MKCGECRKMQRINKRMVCIVAGANVVVDDSPETDKIPCEAYYPRK